MSFNSGIYILLQFIWNNTQDRAHSGNKTCLNKYKRTGNVQSMVTMKINEDPIMTHKEWLNSVFASVA